MAQSPQPFPTPPTGSQRRRVRRRPREVPPSWQASTQRSSTGVLDPTRCIAGRWVGCAVCSGRGSRWGYTRPLFSLCRATGNVPLAGVPHRSSPTIGGRCCVEFLNSYSARAWLRCPLFVHDEALIATRSPQTSVSSSRADHSLRRLSVRRSRKGTGFLSCRGVASEVRPEAAGQSDIPPCSPLPQTVARPEVAGRYGDLW